MDGCSKQYRCASAIYLLSCLYLEFCIIMYRAVGEPVHEKDVVDVLNYRDKLVINLEMEKLLNTKLIQCGTFFQVYAGS